MTNQHNQNITIKPKIGGFLIAYILFSLPGFLISLVTLIIVAAFGIGAIAGLSNAKTDNLNPKLELKPTTESQNVNGILIYDLVGPITSGNFESPVSGESAINIKKVKQDFEQIKKNPNIKNVIFNMNTPGGEIFASEVLGDLIIDLQKSKANTAPNIYFDQLAASGGLWASYKSKAFVLGSPYGETGSIGVIMKLPNFKELAQKVGYDETVIKSSNSKDIGNPLRDVTDVEKDYFQQQLNGYYTKFKKIVGDGRGLSETEVEKLATGLTFPNPEAKQKGLIDQVGDMDFLIAKAAREVNIGTDYQVWTIDRKTNFVTQLLEGKAFNNVFKIQGLENLTPKSSLKAGQAYAIDEMRV